MHHHTFAVKFDLTYMTVSARVVRIKSDRKGKGVEPQGAARPGGIEPAVCCLTPHGFDLPVGIMFPINA
jgi:hypothetical protein